jgi:hypothetical protein
LSADHTAAELPEALSRLLAGLAALSVTNAEAAERLAAALSLHGPSLSAMRLVAQDADLSGAQNSYHNPAHTRAVAVGWANLAVVHNRLAAQGCAGDVLSPEIMALGLCAAFGHDLDHDGVGNFVTEPGPDGMPVTRRVAFRLEIIAADHTAALLNGCGIDPVLVSAVHAAIMVTEPEEGLGTLERESATQWGALTRPDMYCAAQMLRDADLLASVALTAADHDRQTALLGAEIGADLSHPAAAAHLFRRAIAERFHSPAGVLFRQQTLAFQAINALRGGGAPGAGWLPLAAAARRLAGGE